MASSETLEGHAAEIDTCLGHIESNDGEATMEEAMALIKMMKAEARTLAATDRDTWMARIKAIENRAQGAKRSQLMGGNRSTPSTGATTATVKSTGDPNADYIAASAQRQRDMLLESKRQLQETEDIGAATLQDLAKQRETIIKTQKNVAGINQDLDHSSRIMSRMSKFWKG